MVFPSSQKTENGWVNTRFANVNCAKELEKYRCSFMRIYRKGEDDENAIIYACHSGHIELQCLR